MTADPLALLRGGGLDPVEVLGRGMEGVVVALRDEAVVAKVWHGPPPTAATRAALDAVAAAGLPFATPRVLELLDVAGVPVTVEARLPGVPLGRDLDADGWPALVDEHRVECLAGVLAAFAAVEPGPAVASLPLLPGDPVAADGPFEHRLADLVVRRAVTGGGPLHDALGADAGGLVDRTVAALHDLAPARAGLVHGDLVGDNVHVDGPGGPVVAVLDLGFLTTVGDPAFDAAVTASVFDMYGPRHRASEAVLDAAFTTRLRLDPHRLAVHRAAYALATATAYAADGTDGHFAWCVAVLRRDDVRAAVGR